MHWEQGAVLDISWSSDGSLLTAAGTKGPPRTWRLEKGGHKEGEELKALGASIERLSWCPSAHQSSLLAAASYDRTIYLWDQRQSAVSYKLLTSGGNSDISWSPTGRFLATINRDDNKVEFFDMAQRTVFVSADVEDAVYSVKWDHNESMVMLATQLGTVEVYEWPGMRHITRVAAHAASCNCVAMDDHGVMATGGADALVELWNMEDFSVTKTLVAHESPLLFVDFSMDGRFLASASDDLAVRIHEVFSGELMHSLPVDSLTTALEWHPRNQALAYGSAGSGKDSAKPAVTIFLKS
ncbi:THO complex subunit 3 [Kickxella alabastrina]|uniref:THO complex subunit 3 n=1 Tax=Kickxella alabastrina TaxID=61397 RepID=A0ACC1IGG3_9FUNG|nr:THO complex subunit 3 [Kickxella alabastrina]